jgi:hypothetical protein
MQLIGESLSDDDTDVNMFWDYIEGVNFFVNPSVNNILPFMLVLRFAPAFKADMTSCAEGKENY